MEEGINRQAFVGQRQRYQRESNPLAPLLVVLVGLGLLGVAGYLYVSANGMPNLAGGPQPDLAQVVARLEEIEKRLDDIEKRRGSAAPKPSQAQEKTPESESSADNPAAVASAAARTPAKEIAQDASETEKPATDDKQIAELRQRYQSLHGDVAAVKQAWDASTDQLGSVAGELNRQQNEIESNRQKLMRLSDRFDRTPIAFELQGDARERVGPIWLSLRKTHEKAQRYTLRAFIEDKAIELKDRALLEPVELYFSEKTPPLELVVTDIKDEQVSGILRVPKQLSSR